MKSFRNLTRFILACLLPVLWIINGPAAQAQINVITVDCTPFVSPGFSSFGPQLTMGMALQSPLVDPGNLLFNVTEVTPAVFQGMTANQLATFDLIAINNLNSRLNCPVPDGVGLGTTWHSVVGAGNCGGRVLLTSHDAPRFQILPTPFSTPMSGPCPGCEPFGTDELVRDAALWAGSGTGTGLVIFNDSQGFQGGNLGWNNLELSLPVGWAISDSLQGGGFADGGYTQIVAAFAGHPVYANVNDVRLAPNSISSFAANISDTSFHSIFAPGWNAAIFVVSEVVQNAQVVDIGGFNAAFGFGFFQAAQGPDGEAISLIRERQCNMPPVAGCVESVNPAGKTIPPAGSTTLPGPKGGKNDDGFYELLGQDEEDGTADVFVSNASGSATFGPFADGSVVKITEAPGATPSSKPMGGPNSAVAAHIKLDSDAFVVAVDSFGDFSPVVSCLVPPPPK